MPHYFGDLKGQPNQPDLGTTLLPQAPAVPLRFLPLPYLGLRRELRGDVGSGHSMRVPQELDTTQGFYMGSILRFRML